jgi:hypothetical protein
MSHPEEHKLKNEIDEISKRIDSIVKRIDAISAQEKESQQETPAGKEN